MCYKDEVQKKNYERLHRKLKEENVPKFIRDYLEDIESKAGALNYWSSLRDFLLWLIKENIIERDSISDIIIEDFNNLYPHHISKYLRYKEENGISPTTLEMRKNIIRSFISNIRYYKESTIGDINEFFKGVKYKGISSQGNNRIKKFPTEVQLKNMEEKILRKKDEFVKTRNILVLRVLKGTGLRESELAGLNFSDLYINEEVPYIKTVGKGKYREQESRIVYLTGDSLNAIKEWLEYRKNMEYIDKDAVFINKNGKRLNECNIQGIFKIYGNGITPHMIRHWYATLITKTIGLAFAQQQLGHISQVTTTDNYVNGLYGAKDILMNI